MDTIKTQTLGYPRIGPKRELKRALESYWKGKADADKLLTTLHEIEAHAWQSQRDAGVDSIGVGDSTLYDHVLDWAVRFGLIPERFRDLQGLEQYFAMARGVEGVPALELTKWFDTNYHYLVPELEAGLEPSLNADDYLATIRRAQSALGERAVPIVLGPVTLVRLSRVDGDPAQVLAQLAPAYAELLAELDQLGVAEVQLHEPAVVLDDGPELQDHFEAVYPTLAEAGLPLNLVTYFDDPGEAFPWLAALPIDTLTLDFTRGRSRQYLEQHGWPEGLTLAAGIVDGRNIWRQDPVQARALLESLAEHGPLRVSTSSSLQFVPYSVQAEPDLPDALTAVLAFAEEKLGELTTLGAALSGQDISAQAEDWQQRWAAFKQFAPSNQQLAERVDSLQEDEFSRSEEYEQRRSKQVQLPPFPTTTIGSFPQTREIRSLRAQHRRGDISTEEYQDKIDAWIAYTIGVQEGLGLDVLVHGEFERSDMVEYFAHKMTGFAFTQNGWVQSYGSRYVRPPVIYADVTRPEPMTVREFERAQSFTEKPVKGMLTGPVTILNWSFPRMDISRREIAFQLALALRQEIDDLQQAGARVIQVDEPALREGLPFKSERWDEYLDWAVDAFRLATSVASSETQVHTHMCYAEFGDVLGAIDRMSADVISIENARSDDETLRELGQYEYGREVGPGVYDVHSPVIPDREQVVEKLRSFRRHLDPERIWVNPDCGLKTRAWKEVIPSLQSLVEAAEHARSDES